MLLTLLQSPRGTRSKAWRYSLILPSFPGKHSPVLENARFCEGCSAYALYGCVLLFLFFLWLPFFAARDLALRPRFSVSWSSVAVSGCIPIVLFRLSAFRSSDRIFHSYRVSPVVPSTVSDPFRIDLHSARESFDTSRLFLQPILDLLFCRRLCVLEAAPQREVWK